MSRSWAALIIAGAAFLSAPAVAQERGNPPLNATTAEALALQRLPVTTGDIADRPYVSLGRVTATAGSISAWVAANSEEDAARKLWQRAQGLGADAVIHMEIGGRHFSMLRPRARSATGIAIRFVRPVEATPPRR